VPAGARVPVKVQRIAPVAPTTGFIITTPVRSLGRGPLPALRKVVKAGVESKRTTLLSAVVELFV
jgi:hypothetical protein